MMTLRCPSLAPAQVIPFSISKEEAIQAFKKWCKNGRLTPNRFMTEIGQGEIFILKLNHLKP